MKKIVGQRIRYFRKMRGWSQEKLALKANLNTAFVGHLERGLKSPTVSTLEKITEALEISLGELFIEENGFYDEEEEKKINIEKIIYTVRDLSAEDISRIANIICDIVKLKNEKE